MVCVWYACGVGVVCAQCVHGARAVCVRSVRVGCVCKFILPAHTMSKYFYIIFGDRYYESIINTY